jgi:3-deoxy-D-manno-octulosonate 8-phosphate phosphatase (KDO 8-P phosphatase)
VATALIERARQVRLILLDVDGVLTDGKILLHPDGTESKQFHIRDGTGIVLAQKAGVRVGLLSARQSAATTERARQLRIDIVRQGSLDKLTTFEALLAELDMQAHQVAFMGDDLLDLPVLARVGLSATPADAVPEVRGAVHWISQARGGDGAVRELTELVLKAQDRWAPLVAEWTPAPTGR